MTAALLAALLLLAAGCGSDDPPREPQPPAEAGPDLDDADLWLSFEPDTAGDVSATYTDAAGGDAVARVVTANGAALEVVEGPDGGAALAFPPLCPDASGCARAMVEVPDSDAIDPADGDFEFGAAVWLAPDQTNGGENIVQKGRFGTEGGQFKLQVDNVEGHPSCAIRGDGMTTPVLAESDVSIADSRWHRVACRRDAGGVTIVVDGEESNQAGATGSVENEWPVRIGAPGVQDGDDQFHGRVDDVYLVIGS
ncbi:LamG domain-containing protein [Nocardioides anomalus]|uniref:LamG domain-containing protein n=1 Tax=Nocardioides anomalus TaxID=2712223 RepID=A0A6G6WGB8_9ACTN|nr:LamG-like jellyroll fold domain-containing protein [Nocardioides anomalus]QIG44391.1 LamG domain-containing protein [Nocardioides anomalus]